MNGVPDYLEAWITTQRWYAGKSRAPRFEIIGGFRLDGETDAVIQVLLVLDHAEHPLLYQVPLTERTAPLAGAEHALVATLEGDTGTSYVYDGPHDPAYARALLRLILHDGNALAADGSGLVAAHGHHDPSGAGTAVQSSRVLGGEQSNTSIIYEMRNSDGQPSSPVICKIFRALHDGDNPDVVLTGALRAAGSAIVPRVIGHLVGQWRDTGKLHGLATGHLAFAQEFLPGGEDGWRIALRAADAGENFGEGFSEDFSKQAGVLGEIAAEMHETLAAALPCREANPADIAAAMSSMRHRFELAVREVPALAVHRLALDEVYRRAAASPWPPLQRIHGDFHLGQVLAVPGRGWVVLDFEGEPLRPMSERVKPDIPLRDVAGMLRSFDYVAGSFALAHPGLSASWWASACRRAFIDGYIARSGRDLRANRALLDAFEIDKALYETVYEARNRPSWLSIPTEAITRLVERAALA